MGEFEVGLQAQPEAIFLTFASRTGIFYAEVSGKSVLLFFIRGRGKNRLLKSDRSFQVLQTFFHHQSEGL